MGFIQVLNENERNCLYITKTNRISYCDELQIHKIATLYFLFICFIMTYSYYENQT